MFTLNEQRVNRVNLPREHAENWFRPTKRTRYYRVVFGKQVVRHAHEAQPSDLNRHTTRRPATQQLSSASPTR